MKSSVVVVGLYVYGTGLTRVTQIIADALACQFDVHFIAVGYSGSATAHAGLTVHPAGETGGDVLGAFLARDLVKAIRPRAVVIVQDIWFFQAYVDALDSVRETTRIIGYVPIDGCIVDPRTASALLSLDRVVVYTQWARREVQSAFARLIAGPAKAAPPVDVIAHGVDTSVFHPSDELYAADLDRKGRFVAKEQVFPGLEQSAESFIVLNANRLDIRKRIDLTFTSFSLFARDKPGNVKLCLHQPFMSSEKVALVREMATACGVAERLLFNPLNPGHGAVPDHALNLLYNATDVGLNTSMGEGWGLLSFEHAAAGAAQIVPKHTACEDLWAGVAEVVPTAEHGVPWFSPLQMSAVSVQAVADTLDRLYWDRLALRQCAWSCYKRATESVFDWSNIASQWRTLIETISN